MLATPSRPLSRSSTMSGLSTTATKDGVEGNRIHRFHDPQGYTKWISSTMPDDGSFTSSSANSVAGSDLDDMLVENQDDETPGPREDDSVLDLAAGMVSKARLQSQNGGGGVDDEDDVDFEYQYYDDRSVSSATSSNNGGPTTNSNNKLFSKTLFSKANSNNHNNINLYNAGPSSSVGFNQQQDQDYAPTPPNDPRAPPVTLNEKIRLLRTGSVSRNRAGTEAPDNSAKASNT